MREVFGDMFSYVGRPGFKICITTNGFVKNDGTGVMGAGCAKKACEYNPDLPRLLGLSIRARKNVVANLTEQFISFPVKHNWWEKADVVLIGESLRELKRKALAQPELKFILPRPGCGNGKLAWEDVKYIIESIDIPDNIWIIAPWSERPHD